MNKRRLLIVDDDAELRGVLPATAHRRRVRGGRGGHAEAQERVAAGPLDLMVLDVGLPDMDGREGSRSCARRVSRARHHAHRARQRGRRGDRA